MVVKKEEESLVINKMELQGNFKSEDIKTKYMKLS